MSANTADIHFALDAQRDRSRVLDAGFADDDDARRQAARVARVGDVQGARLVRGVHRPSTAEPIVTTVLDTTDADHRVAYRRGHDTAPAAADDAENGPPRGDTWPRPRRPTPAPGRIVPALGALGARLTAAVAIRLVVR